MNQKARRWVMLSFLLFFLIVSPILILYSLGFKYNWQKNRLEKTGVFFIKSFPKNSEVYLDGQPIGKKTPTQITRLLAKNYQLEIKKEGYRPWSKNLEILPQITTFIEDVSLFKEELNPEILMAGTFAGLLPSPNRQMIALIEESCSIRKTPHSYLLKWSHFKSDENEKEVFRRDITSSKELIIFCKDLVNFLSDLAHSCPKAIDNLKAQQ